MLYGEDATVEVDALRGARPRIELENSSRSFDGPRHARCESGILFSLELRSPRGLFPDTFGAVHSRFWGSNLGMRLMLVGSLEESEAVPFEKEGREGTGDPGDRG